jgi:hypothetical protein
MSFLREIRYAARGLLRKPGFFAQPVEQGSTLEDIRANAWRPAA